MTHAFEGNKAKVLSSVINKIDIFVRNDVYPARTDITRWLMEAIEHLTLDPLDLAEGVKALGEEMLLTTIAPRFYGKSVNYVLDALYREEMFDQLYPEMETLIRDVATYQAERSRS